MPAKLLDESTISARFYDVNYVNKYLTESLDTGSIHQIEKISGFWQQHPDFRQIFPSGNLVIPAAHVLGPAIGLFYQNVGEGFLLRNMSIEQTAPVFLGESIIYKIKKFGLKKVTSKGFRVFECLVEAKKEKGGEMVGTHEMVAFQH